MRGGRQWRMNQGRTVFSQLISFLPDREVPSLRRALSGRHPAARLHLGAVSGDGLRTVDLSREAARHRSLFALVARQTGSLGFRGKVARSTLVDANESRDWRIFADFAHRLIATARRLYVREPRHHQGVGRPRPSEEYPLSRDTQASDADRTAATINDRSDHGKVFGDRWSSEMISPSS
jgi:hypothetical protein